MPQRRRPPSGGSDDAPARIAVLPAALADQIAAGEVVERPGSIVKELIDNAIDAGATRIDVELVAGGRERIRVIDDGCGIHPEDLILAVTRHATSKLRTPDQLIEIHTLGFRGEALASIAAVAQVEIRSRRLEASVGHRLASRPGDPPTLEPIGMPAGTQVEIGQLFANVPARRKFLRAEATEVGHCIDAVIRVALVHPQVGFRVRHDGRELLELRVESQTARVIAVLERRGGVGPFHHFQADRDGVHVAGWFASPSPAIRPRNGSFIVVRRRVVRERTLAGMLRQAYGDGLDGGAQPVACVFVDPPRGAVDVNVHPQKSEVRFAAAQQVYAAVRELIEAGLATAPWAHADSPDHQSDDSGHAWAAVRDGSDSTHAALAGWTRREGLASELADRSTGYRLGTRAAQADYASERREFRGDVDRLRASLATGSSRDHFSGPSLPTLPHLDAAFDDVADPETRIEPEPEPEPGPRLLTCLPGPVAVFEFDGELLVADLRRVRAHLVRRRLLRELAASERDGRAPAQGLLQPIVIPRPVEQRERLLAAAPALARLGLELEGFGDAAVLVRAVPAALPKLLDARGIGALLDRLIPWLAIRDQSVDQAGFVDAVAQVYAGTTVDINPRLARRWIAELFGEHGQWPDPREDAGVRRWTARALLGGDS